jgi:two-component system chemotaxis sensor kinase CheA
LEAYVGTSDEIVREFLVESYENLDQLDQDLVALEGHPGSRELLSRVFRTIHTIKGTCGFLAFGRLEALTHAGESLLSELRDGRRAMNQPTTDVLLAMVDTVREILACIETSGVEGDIAVDAVIEQIRGVLGDPGTQTSLDEDIRDGDIRDEDILDEDILDLDISDGDIPVADVGPSSDVPGRVTASDSAIRVDVEVLDDLMRQVGELLLARNQISRLVGGQLDADLIRASQHLSLIASELQDCVMSARMQPIGHLWSKMPRVVRDLAAACGRQVRLEVAGGDTELDRALLEAVKDPLMHLVRNAVDHGIEDAPTRVAAGKPATGVLTMRAYHAGGRVVVEVQDDGQGIDVDRVGATALARGLRTPQQIAALSQTDLQQLLFLPGFSMAQRVTNVSGRGVGLDVVHTKIAAIGGTVEVESAVGRGTTWRLRIPLTLAIISAIIVECAGERYAIPSVNVLEFVAADGKTSEAAIEHVGPAPVLRVHGALLPLVGLRDVLGLPHGLGSGHDGEPDMPTVVAVLADTRRFGLTVDRVLDTEEIVVKPIPARLTGVGVYAGATLLGDGRVALILDVQGIAVRSLTGQWVQAEPEPGDATPEPVEGGEQVLLVGIGQARRVAIPLGAVTRLERVSRDVVEHVGGREVFQYRQGIVPLVALDQALGGRAKPAGGDLQRQDQLVVIFTRGARTVAITVQEVLDIMDDDPARHSKIDDRGEAVSTVLGGRVTELLDVRRAVLLGDPSFFDDDGADDPLTPNSFIPNAALAALGAVGV